MRRDDVEAFLERGWAEVEASSAAHWRTLTPTERLAVADELRRSVAVSRPGWPSATEREADLANHVRVAELLRRAEANRKR